MSGRGADRRGVAASIPSRLASGNDASAFARPSTKPSTRAESGSRASSLRGDVDGELRRAIGGGGFLGGARPAHFGLGGGAHLIDVLASGGERRGALGLGVLGGLAQHVVPGRRRFGRLPASAASRAAIACSSGRLRVEQNLGRRRPPLVDDRNDRAEQEPAQDPDENEDVDRLQAERPPVDPHRGAAYLMNGLANSTSSAMTRQ